MKAHIDPDLFVRWVGPDAISSRIIEWDARDGGSWRYVSTHDGQEFGFRGCFHTVADDKIVQTFTFEGMPDQVSLETLWFEDLGDGHTRLHAQSLCDSFEARDGWLASGMEVGVNEGYAGSTACSTPVSCEQGTRRTLRSDRHRDVAAGFAEHAAAVEDWDARRRWTVG